MGMGWQRGWSVASCIPIGAGLSQDWSDGDGCPDTRSRAARLRSGALRRVSELRIRHIQSLLLERRANPPGADRIKRLLVTSMRSSSSSADSRCSRWPTWC